MRLLLLLLLPLAIGTAQAQETNANAGAAAQAGSQSASLSGAAAISGSSEANINVLLDQSAPGRSVVESRQTGTATLKYAPAVTAPSFGSGHPCGLAASVGISVIGGGASGGNTRVDEACLLAQMNQGEAALIMIARRDTEACIALRQLGRISAASDCGDGGQAEEVATADACYVKPGTTRTVVTSATTQEGKLACAARLGLQ